MSESRLTPSIDVEEVSPEEAFAALGDETRLEIVRVLWEAGAAHRYDDVSDETETMSFTELRRRAGVDDNGRFNYHVSKLAPHFVRRTEEGYRLSGAGKRIARTVIAVTGVDDLNFETDLQRDCPLCGAAMLATYEEQWLRVRCTECAGLFGDEAPTGTIYYANYPAAGMTDRAAEETTETGLYRCMLDNSYMMHGLCRECGGGLSASVSVCEGHAAGADPCADCGTQFEAWAEQRCDTCRFAKRLPVELFVVGLTPVIGFLDSLGVDALAPSFEEVVVLLEDHVETAVERDPLRLRTTLKAEGRRLSVTLDDEMSVVDLERPGDD